MTRLNYLQFVRLLCPTSAQFCSKHLPKSVKLGVDCIHDFDYGDNFHDRRGNQFQIQSFRKTVRNFYPYDESYDTAGLVSKKNHGICYSSFNDNLNLNACIFSRLCSDKENRVKINSSVRPDLILRDLLNVWRQTALRHFTTGHPRANYSRSGHPRFYILQHSHG